MRRPSTQGGGAPTWRHPSAGAQSLYEIEDGRFRADGQWWVVWRLARLVEDNLRAWAEGMLDRRLIAFGDDGTGNPFCVRSDDSPELVLRWDWIDAAVEYELSMPQFVNDWLAP